MNSTSEIIQAYGRISRDMSGFSEKSTVRSLLTDYRAAVIVSMVEQVAVELIQSIETRLRALAINSAQAVADFINEINRALTIEFVRGHFSPDCTEYKAAKRRISTIN